MAKKEATEAKPKSALQKELPVSKALAAVIGVDKTTRPQATKLIWAYIKAKNLQDPVNKKTIRPDAVLAQVLGSDPIDMFKMPGAINKHFIK
jgi:chromatin remodeling complex protein RSC6